MLIHLQQNNVSRNTFLIVPIVPKKVLNPSTLGKPVYSCYPSKTETDVERDWLQKDLTEPMPGYLSLHQTAHSLTIKWTPNQLMNGYPDAEKPENKK